MGAAPQDLSPASGLAAQMPSVLGYYAAVFALGLAAAVFGPTLPGLAQQTHTDLRTVSVLFTARAFGYMLGSLQSGRWYDHRPGHAVLAAGLLLMAVTMVLIPFMSRLGALTAVILALGVADGMVDVGSNTLLVWVYRDKVGPWMNGLHFCFGLGALLAPVVVAQAMAISGEMTGAYWALAVLMVPGACWLLRLPSPTVPTGAHDGSAARGTHGLVLLIALFTALYVGAEVGFGGWIFSYVVALNLSDAPGAAYLTAAFWGALTVGRLLAVPVAMRVRPSTIVLGALVGCLLSVGLMLLGAHSVVAIWLGTGGLGLCMASIFPTTLVFAERRLVMTGRVTGWFLVGASVGAMSLPWLMGQLFESMGPRVSLSTIMATLMVATGVFGIVMRCPTRPAGDGP
jgi:MFS transporter, FHS family, Na+ dependent glucose transporter 1